MDCASIYGKAVNSGLLEARKVETPEVPTTAVAEARFVRQCDAGKQVDRKPKEWPSGWNLLMNSRKMWQSLSPQVLLSACLSWQAVCRHMEEKRQDSIGRSWWCRLLKPTHLYQHVDTGTLTFVVGAGKFAAVGIPLQTTQEEGQYTFAGAFQSRPMKDCLMLVENPKVFQRKHYIGYRVKDHLVVRLVERETSGMSLVQCGLMDRRNWTKFELVQALWQLTELAPDEGR